MDNKVIGSKLRDNKDPKNRQLVKGVSQMGEANPHLPPTVKATQNSKNVTPPGPDQSGDSGVKVAAKRSNKIIRKNTSFSDNAIKSAINQAGQRYLRGGR